MTSVFRWRIKNYGDRLGSAIFGDEWASDVFTLQREDNPQCYLKFRPPIQRVEYSPPECPFLPTTNQNSSIDLCFLNSPPSTFKAKIWAEDKHGGFPTPKQPPTGYDKFCFKNDFLKSWDRNSLVICCEYEIQQSLQDDYSPPSAASLVVDRSATLSQFRWNNMDKTGQIEFNYLDESEKSFRLNFYQHYTVVFTYLGSPYDRLFHFKAWMENDSGDRTYKTEGIRRLMNTNGQQWSWSPNVTIEQKRAFFGSGPSRFCLNLRPIRRAQADKTFAQNPMSCDNEQRATKLLNFIAKNGSNEKYGDVKIRCKDGKIFYASKMLLAAYSPVFCAIFGNETTVESQTKTIEMDDFDSAPVASMLEFIHTGKVENMKNVDAGLYVVADRYELTELQELCLKSMTKNFSSGTILDYLKLAFTYENLSDFKSRVIAYATNNLKAVMSLDKWKSFRVNHIEIVDELLLALT